MNDVADITLKKAHDQTLDSLPIGLGNATTSSPLKTMELTFPAKRKKRKLLER
ncbi:hypothetical protein ACLOJK_036112 [Asimina triloba]